MARHARKVERRLPHLVLDRQRPRAFLEEPLDDGQSAVPACVVKWRGAAAVRYVQSGFRAVKSVTEESFENTVDCVPLEGLVPPTRAQILL